MALKDVHDTIEEIPENYRDLYTEREGKFYLTGIAGVKTQADIDRLNGSLEKERKDRKAAAASLTGWTALGFETPEEAAAKLDRFAELEVAAAGNKDEMDAQLETLLEARIGSRLAPVERENKTLKTERDTAMQELETLRTEKRNRIIGDNVLKAATNAKVLSTAQADVQLLASAVFEITEQGELLTKENPYGVAPGLTPELFFTEMQAARPHWWAASVGGGATGGDRLPAGTAKNPWSKEAWNLTEQGKILREHGRTKAEALAKAAGSFIGATGPKK